MNTHATKRGTDLAHVFHDPVQAYHLGEWHGQEGRWDTTVLRCRCTCCLAQYERGQEAGARKADK